jgi:hypothetical protein
MIEISGYGGVLIRGKSSTIAAPNSFTWASAPASRLTVRCA